ncbi:Peroxidase 50 [Vitis vinifera]|uniref:Peroxidase n=1 Tax=Vitis vinifera TaxID=29760 RepID=A0A438EUR9_VITVI|nr:Peroxidase 50 [Vitis vinifera]
MCGQCLKMLIKGDMVRSGSFTITHSSLFHGQGLIFPSLCSLLPILAVGLVPYTATAYNASGLSYDFYEKSCPNVERIIHNVVSQKLTEAFSTAGGALRIFFHDCFVEVGSVPPTLLSQEALELQCPGIVSCTDVMAIATRDLLNLVGAPRWEVLKGRKDGLVSKASRVTGNIPEPTQTVSELISLFKSKGLSVLDMVALSGGHTIGFSHCDQFMSRIYSFNETFDIDPTMDKDYAQMLQESCPEKTFDRNIVLPNDVSTPQAFDNAYYTNLQKGLGLLSSDQILALDPTTQGYVNSMAENQQVFFRHFVRAMIKLGEIGVKTGSNGEIRQDCGVFNS